MNIGVGLALCGCKQAARKNIIKYPNMNNGRVRHPGDRSVEFSIFLSCNGVHNITLRGESCMCEACYRECTRGEGKPRWVGLSKQLICKHCFVAMILVTVLVNASPIGVPNSI